MTLVSEEKCNDVVELPKCIRLFVAINLPSVLKSKLSEVQDELSGRVQKAAIRWTRPEQLHITLKFLGYVAETKLPEIQASLSSAVNGTHRFELKAQGLGCFPNARSPRVVWVGIQGDLESLLPLQKRIEAATARWAEPEKRGFAPHLTLGRVKEARRKDSDAIAQFVKSNETARFGNWTVEQVDLMQSVLSPRGPTYTCLSSVVLV